MRVSAYVNCGKKPLSNEACGCERHATSAASQNHISTLPTSKGNMIPHPVKAPGVVHVGLLGQRALGEHARGARRRDATVAVGAVGRVVVGEAPGVGGGGDAAVAVVGGGGGDGGGGEARGGVAAGGLAWGGKGPG